MGKLKQLAVGQQVMLLFGLICAILAAIGGLFFFSLRTIESDNQRQQADALGELTLVDDTAQDIGQMQAGVLREILASDPAEIKRIDQAVHDIEKTNAKELVDYVKFANSEEEKELSNKIIQAQKVYWEQTEPVLALAHANKDAEARDLINSTQAKAYDDYLKAIDELILSVENEAKESAQATSRFISRTRIIGDTLVGMAIFIAIGTGWAVERIARRLKKDNIDLQAEVGERIRAEENLRSETALLEAQVNSSIDGILVVDSEGRKTLQNKRLDELWKIPPHLTSEEDDKKVLEWVSQRTKNPEQFAEKVAYLYTHPNEISHDEIELLDGTVLDRYTSPIVGKDGKCYGRIWSFRDITERKLAEARIERLRTEHRTILNSVSEGMYWIDLDLRIKYENPACIKMLGYEPGELIGKQGHPAIHHSRADGTPYSMADCPICGPTVKDGIVRHVKDEVFWRKDGTSFPVEYTSTPIRDESGQLAGAVVVFTDVTERKHLEARMFQSQKMETVGKLAGGIAHEFNSILTAIIGQSEFLTNDLSAENPLGKSAREIRQAADRAAVLTRQLLAYGRKQILQPEILDLNQVLTAMLGTLQHLVGREIDVRTVPAQGLKMVKIDPGQMEQVIVNITMNAADAMPNGGKLTLETSNVTLDEEYVRAFPGLKAGPYVLLSMTDTGTGMSEDVKARAFEPFFSTKGVGQGTGLGLSTCYGILKQSDGHINVYSEVARGTTFKIYLPQIQKQATITLPRLASPGLPRGTETILLAEDDPSLLEMSASLLRRLGYTVLTAVNGVEALSLKNQRDIGHIDLLFTDIVMPHMSGKELSDRIRSIYPRTKILFTSAYTENAIVHHGMLNEGVVLLQKPFTPSALANKVREVLDKPFPV